MLIYASVSLHVQRVGCAAASLDRWPCSDCCRKPLQITQKIVVFKQDVGEVCERRQNVEEAFSDTSQLFKETQYTVVLFNNLSTLALMLVNVFFCLRLYVGWMLSVVQYLMKMCHMSRIKSLYGQFGGRNGFIFTAFSVSKSITSLSFLLHGGPHRL